MAWPVGFNGWATADMDYDDESACMSCYTQAHSIDVEYRMIQLGNASRHHLHGIDGCVPVCLVLQSAAGSARLHTFADSLPDAFEFSTYHKQWMDPIKSGRLFPS